MWLTAPPRAQYIDPAHKESAFFKELEASGHKLKFRKVAEQGNMVLQTHGEWDFDNVIVFSETKTAPSEKSLTNLLEFVDAGGNLILAGGPNSSKWARDLAFECGVTLGSQAVVDRFAPSTPEFVAAEWPAASKVLGDRKESTVRFSGTTAKPSSDAMTMGAVRVLVAPRSAYASKKPLVSGHDAVLVSAVQMRNNARVVVSGSATVFLDKANNSAFRKRLAAWAFAERAVLRVTSFNHRKTSGEPTEHQNHHPAENKQPKSTFPDPEWGPNAWMYRIKDEVLWSMVIEELDEEAGGWKPYKAEDVQLEFVMLNPYERRTMKHDGRGNFSTTVMVPDQYGVFTFRVKYTRPGVSNLLVLEQANVRPYRHDEYDRFLICAFPYYTAALGYMAAFFLFSVAFLMTPMSR